MRAALLVARRELAGYFATPVAYVFIVIFLMMAGAYLAIGSAMSAMTKNQVIAFVLAVAVCFLFAVAGSALVTDFLSQRIPALAEIARAVSLTERFNGLTRGVIALRDAVFFASFIGFWLFVNAVVLDHRKAD